MPDLHLHNTLTGKKEIFKPLKPGHVSMYVCGITPYDESHIGHARCYVVFDLLKRVLALAGYQVNHIQNFTDVDDKIINRAHELKQPAVGFAEPYMQSFKKYMEQLNVVAPNEYPLVTENIKEIKELIQRLIDKGVAYELNGDVYYSVRKFSAYGKLSKRKIDELAQGARVEVNEQKHDPLDFALWKKAKEGEPFWESSWGKGRPGWHIECSVINNIAFEGKSTDIHTGGVDLIFPHHTNEIAQSQPFYKPFSKYWAHCEHLQVDGKKMAKSAGNFYTLRDITEKGYNPLSYRYFCFLTHYRTPINFSWEALTAAQNALENIQTFYALNYTESTSIHRDYQERFQIALCDDLNTSMAIAVVWDLIKDTTVSDDVKIGTLAYFDQVLGIGLSNLLPEITPEVQELILLRDTARTNKDWQKSDELRDQIESLGYKVFDTTAGTKIIKKF
jgi:cysteinyl-tRNA synthetase